jgi:hypothetical protein
MKFGFVISLRDDSHHFLRSHRFFKLDFIAEMRDASSDSLAFRGEVSAANLTAYPVDGFIGDGDGEGFFWHMSLLLGR